MFTPTHTTRTPPSANCSEHVCQVPASETENFLNCVCLTKLSNVITVTKLMYLHLCFPPPSTDMSSSK